MRRRRGAPQRGRRRRGSLWAETKPRVVAKVEQRRRRKAEVVAELGQAATLMQEPGATRVPPVAAPARATKRAAGRM